MKLGMVFLLYVSLIFWWNILTILKMLMAHQAQCCHLSGAYVVLGGTPWYLWIPHFCIDCEFPLTWECGLDGQRLIFTMFWPINKLSNVPFNKSHFNQGTKIFEWGIHYHSHEFHEIIKVHEISSAAFFPLPQRRTIQLLWANYSTAPVATLTTLTGQVLGVVSARRMQRMHVQVRFMGRFMGIFGKMSADISWYVRPQTWCERWFRFTPVTIIIVISTINHSYWSYVHQLSYPTGASHCMVNRC